MAKVYHANQPNFGMPIGESQNWPDDFTLVAETETNNLEEIFRLTNTIDSPWWENPGVKAIQKPCRSTSVGDMILTDDRLWYCDMVGWKPVRVKVFEPALAINKEDGDKLRTLAKWFDEEQKKGRWESQSNEVQDDLNRIANFLDAVNFLGGN